MLWESFPDKIAKHPRDAGKVLGIASKRVCYLCKKWAKQGVYEYGTSIDLGWKTNGH
jgi:hypothetical protein